MEKNVAQPCSCASRNACGAFDITGNRGGSRKGAGYRAECIREQGPARARESSVAQKSALFTNAHQRAHIVEEVHEEEHKDELAEPEMGCRTQVQFQERAGRMRQGKKVSRPTGQFERYACKRNP